MDDSRGLKLLQSRPRYSRLAATTTSGKYHQTKTKHQIAQASKLGRSTPYASFALLPATLTTLTPKHINIGVYIQPRRLDTPPPRLPRPIGDVVDDHRHRRVSDIAGDEGPETLLPGGIPQLKPHRAVLQVPATTDPGSRCQHVFRLGCIVDVHDMHRTQKMAAASRRCASCAAWVCALLLLQFINRSEGEVQSQSTC